MDEDQQVHVAIWEKVPELRERLVGFERHRVEADLELGIEPYVGAYSLISDVLVHPHLLPLLDADEVDGAALQRCADAIEQILEVRSSFLTEAVGIRVVEHLLSPPRHWLRFRPFAGPLLKAEVLEASKFFTWPYDEPVV